jgi:copper transport protein
VVALVATGLYEAGVEVREAADLVDTAYGRTLLVKAGLLVVLLGLGAANSARLHGWWAHPLGRRLLVAEAGTGAVLLLAVAVLVETPPARDPVPAQPSPRAATRSGAVGDLVLSVSATPNRPGLNGFTVIAVSNRRPAPAAVDTVALVVSTGDQRSTVAMQPVGADRWFGSTELSAPGAVRIDAVVQRAGQRLVVPVVWTVGPRPGPPPAALPPAHALAPYVDALAVAVLVLAGLAWLGYGWRRRRARGRPAEPGEPGREPRVPVSVSR